MDRRIDMWTGAWILFTLRSVSLVPDPDVVLDSSRRPPLLMREFLANRRHSSPDFTLQEFEFLFRLHGNEDRSELEASLHGIVPAEIVTPTSIHHQKILLTTERNPLTCNQITNLPVC